MQHRRRQKCSLFMRLITCFYTLELWNRVSLSGERFIDVENIINSSFFFSFLSVAKFNIVWEEFYNQLQVLIKMINAVQFVDHIGLRARCATSI